MPQIPLSVPQKKPHILWVELKRFYAGASGEPLVIVRDKCVLDANDAARKRGIRSGIPVRQAKAILQGGIFKAWESDEYEARSRAWLDQCIDFTGAIEPADQHTAWLDLSLHPSPVDVAEKLIRALAQKTGLSVHFGGAPSKWIACLAAEHADCGLAIRDPKEFLSPLPVTELLPAPLEHRERLRFLGYHTIGEVAALALPTLQEQFGNDGLIVHSAANGLLTQSVKASYPPCSVAESIVFDGAVETIESIHEACRTLAERIGERLSARSLQSTKLRVVLELEDRQLRPLSRTFTKPLRCLRSVYSAMRLLIDPVLDAPIASIRVLIPDLEKVRLVQASLLNGPAVKEARLVELAVQHIQTAFGDGSVKLGKEIELPRRVKVLKEWKHATGWR